MSCLWELPNRNIKGQYHTYIEGWFIIPLEHLHSREICENSTLRLSIIEGWWGEWWNKLKDYKESLIFSETDWKSELPPASVRNQ